jgi:hypothetical protein
MRYSIFFSQPGNDTVAIEKMSLENSNRLSEAHHYLKSLNETKLHGTFHSFFLGATTREAPAVTVALTVITVSRNRHVVDSYEPMYLTQVIWKFLSLLQFEQHLVNSDSFPVIVNLSICNVDHDPASYAEANQVSQFVPMFSRFAQTHFSMVHILEKEKQDYVFCLNHSMATHPDYVFLVEDDAMPSDDIFKVLRHVLEAHMQRKFLHGEYVDVNENIAYVKFYHPERLLNFIAFDRERLPELFSYVALLSSVLTALYMFCFKTDTTVTVNVIWQKLSIFSLLVILACGRTGVSEWRRVASPTFYSLTPAPSCCTPAMLFPNTAAQQTVAYLNATTCQNNFGKDSVLDNMVHEKAMTAYLVQPNTFTHIGMYSSIRDRIVDPFMV